MFPSLIPQAIVWHAAAAALLLVSFNILATLNSFPSFNLLMRLTNEFIFEYLRLFMYLVMMMVAFAISVHFLLADNPSFHTIWNATIALWMKGDLGYDNTFLGDQVSDKLPILDVILYVLFVAFLGLLMTAHGKMRENAPFHRASDTLELQLFIDDCVPMVRRKFAVTSKIILYNEKTILNNISNDTKQYSCVPTQDSKYNINSSVLHSKGKIELENNIEVLNTKIDHLINHLEIGRE